MRESKVNKNCGQHFDELEMIEYHCNYGDCKRCGHNPRVAAYRKRMLAKYGMAKGKNGLWRYIVKRRYANSGKHEK